MEFCGSDLYSTLERLQNEGQSYPVDVVQQKFRQLVSGIYFMHLNGFAHRDFNHENVMIDEKGDVKVLHSGLECILIMLF
jgi:serine/threonine protein kinase